MLSGLRGYVTDLVIYFSAWSAVFSVYAIWHGRRLIYLLALYLALIGLTRSGATVHRTTGFQRWCSRRRNS
ncbi:MAG: hypothetical protein M3461_20840 [Pseudomonadota bacterium]|nr:hypothetical protein [Pseudomonadota bacterium]